MDKLCPKCNILKPSFAFSKNKSAKDGFQTWCKMCMKEQKSTPKAKEEAKRYDKIYRSKNLELAKTFGTPLTNHLGTEDPYIDIWLRFDNHYGHIECDVLGLNKYVEWAKAPNVYQILGGDIIENVPPLAGKIPHLFSQSIDPAKQLSDILPTLNRSLCYIIGNHEGRSNRISRVLTPNLELMLTKFKIPILRQNNHVYTLFVNDIRYTFLLSHGHGGSQTQEFILKKMLRDQLVPDEIDFLVVGHTHHNTPQYPVDRAVIAEGYIGTKRLIGIRPGSFLYNPSYLKYGRETIRGNVVLRLSAKKWNYRLFENLTDLQENEL